MSITKKPIHDITAANVGQAEMADYRGGNPIQFIVIHYLGVANADNPNLYGGGLGGHYNITRDGTIYKAADPRKYVVWHCGGGLQGYDPGSARYFGVCTNYNSIGIENGVNFDGTWYFSQETQESLVYLVSTLMDEYGIDINHVIRHWDVTGKHCPAPYVENTGYKANWTWNQFLNTLQNYRNGKSTSPASETWKATGTATCTADGVNVRATPAGTILGQLGKGNRFEIDGKTDGNWTHIKVAGFGICWIYTDYVKKDTPAPATTTTTTTTKKTTGTQAKSLKGLSEAAVVKKMGSVFTADQKKSGILASVSMAQFILESGYGQTELAQNANNVFGMKCSLSGNTWSGSTWDGKSKYTKKTQEEYTPGQLTTITADFRKYPNIEDSIADHSAYLLGAMNGSKKRYAGLKGETSYKKAITIIKNGGYATDSQYVDKICNIIERWNLTQYDVKKTTTTTTTTWKATGTAICAEDGVNIRKTPGGTIVGQLNCGMRFEINNKTDGNWTNIKVAGIGECWIYTAYVVKDAVWKATGTATCKCKNATGIKVRSTPSNENNDNILGRVLNGQRFEVDGKKKKGWIHIKVAGFAAPGWIYKTWVKYDK